MICKTVLGNPAYKCSINNINKESSINIKMYDLHLKNIFIKDATKNLTCTYTLLPEKDILELELSLYLDDINIDNINFQSINEREIYEETARQYILLGKCDSHSGWFGPLIRYADINKRQMLFEFITDEKYSKIIHKQGKFQKDIEISNFVVIQEGDKYKYIFNNSEFGCFIFQK